MKVGPDWGSFVSVRVRTKRIAGSSGAATYSSPYLEVPCAVGVIELEGGRVGRHFTSLHVGFSLASKLPGPSFVLTEEMAAGSLVLPGVLFQAWLMLVNGPAYFRIGGDGSGNGISSDQAFWL